jgi:type II secretory pathway component PulF
MVEDGFFMGGPFSGAWGIGGVPTYRYRAVGEQGGIVEGIAAAASRRALADELTGRGLIPGSIRRCFLSLPVRLTDDELLLFLGEFSALVRAGVPIPEALGAMSEFSGRSVLRTVLPHVRMQVLQGISLSEALASHPAIFNPLMISLIRVGEKSGEMVGALSRCQSLIERKASLRRKMRQALVYPVFVMVMLAAIITVLLFFSLPRFIDIYADLDHALPAPTLLLVNFAGWFGRYAWLILPGLTVFILAAREWKPSRRWRLFGETVLGKLPALGLMREAYLLSLCCHILHSLTASGMTMVDALRHASRALPDLRFADAMSRASERITEGEGLVQSLRLQKILPPAAMKLLEAGEKSGMVSGQLEELARYFDGRFEHRLAMVVSLIEPMLVLVTGLLVGAAVLAMYLPIFGMAGALG